MSAPTTVEEPTPVRPRNAPGDVAKIRKEPDAHLRQHEYSRGLGAWNVGSRVGGVALVGSDARCRCPDARASRPQAAWRRSLAADRGRGHAGSAGTAGSIAVRRHTPSSSTSTPSGALVYIHEGGFTYGTFDEFEVSTRPIAERAGIVTYIVGVSAKRPCPRAGAGRGQRHVPAGLGIGRAARHEHPR
jgi:hypothetical protein